MASSRLTALFTLTLLISTATSRVITPSSSESSASANAPNVGPIHTNGVSYKKVCDRDRFASLGLDMDDFTYCDKSLSYPERVKDLIERLTVDEKILNMQDLAPGSPRIGFPDYKWWSEALHGVASSPGSFFNQNVKGATSFPTPLLSTASFNETLWKTLGQAVSTEARAMYNVGNGGLTFWSPVINVVRDPRWGRTLETPGEDPFVVGTYGVNYIRGLQDIPGHEYAEDPNSRPLKVSGCCKHFTAYDLDKWFHLSIARQAFDARVTEQDMVETFNRPFEMCVREGDGSSIMCSFNNINGIPVCADPRRMYQTFRGEWDLHGYVVSDCDALQIITQNNFQHWLHDTPEDAVAQTIRAGLDLACGWGHTHVFRDHAVSAIQKGKVKESDLDNGLTNLFIVLMRLGFFDGNPDLDDLGYGNICSKQHSDLAVEAAAQSIVLLKNDDNTLPLDPKTHNTIAMIGPHSDATHIMIGNYAGVPCNYITPLAAFEPVVQVQHVEGCDVRCSKADFFGVSSAASNNSATVLFFGISTAFEREEYDKDTLWLPGKQADLINAAINAASGPVILVVFSATCIDVSFAQNNPKVGAILWVGYPGEAGGQAIADVIFGRTNPSGRLPITWYYNDYVESLPMTSMQLRPVKEFGYPGRTYKFYDGPVQYPFGYGLSYTQFRYTLKSATMSVVAKRQPLQQCKSLTYKPDVRRPACPALAVVESLCQETIDFEMEVANVGQVDGSNIVLVYSKPPTDVDEAPIKQLVAFQRAFVPAGQSVTLSFSLNACKALSIVEKSAYVVLPAGSSRIIVGDDELCFHVNVSFKY